MSRGRLSDQFTGVAFKHLSAVEANTLVSNQHEYNGTAALKRVFGVEQPRTISTRFFLLGDERDTLVEDGFLTWYDARARHPTRSEYRLYFPTNGVTAGARKDDGLFIASRPNGEAVVIVTPKGSSALGQLLLLFGLQDSQADAFQAVEYGTNAAETDFVARLILDQLGIEAEGLAEDRLDDLIDPFGLSFPPTREFSEFARSTLPFLDPVGDPDGTLLTWVEREEQLFRRLERRIVAERLTRGFSEDGVVDVDGFVGYSLSVQNRRKSRAGSGFENHLAFLFTANGLRFGHGVETENGNRPDFLFPGREEYLEAAFPEARLTMLGAKTTCKDRWRQVLSEAVRIPAKHLVTLEPGISRTQTDEMAAKQLQLVLPGSIFRTYQASQQSQLITVTEFIALVAARQSDSAT